MSLRVRYSSQSPIVDIGGAIHFVYDSDVSNTFGFANTVKAFDLLLERFAQDDFYVGLGGRSLVAMLGLTGISDIYSDTFVSGAIKDWPYSEPIDTAIYGNFSRGMQLLTSLLFGGNQFPPSMGGENSCRHRSLQGEVFPRQVAFPSSVHPYSFFGEDIEATHWGSSAPECSTISFDGDRLGVVDTYNNISTNKWNIVDVVKGLEGKSIDFLQFYGVIPVHRRLSNLRYSVSPTELWIQYDGGADAPTLGRTYDWRCSFRIPLRDPAPSTPIEDGDLVCFDDSGPVNFMFRELKHTDLLGDIGPYSDDYSSGSLAYFYMTDPTSILDLAAGELASSCQTFLDVHGYNFQLHIDGVYNDITASASFSSADAFLNAEGSLRTNVLQDLQKLPGIAKTLPQITEAVRVLEKLLGNDLSLSTLKDILDLATSTNLQANFEWRPYMDLLTKYIPEMVSTLNRLGFPPNLSVAYGSFSKDLGKSLGRESVTLVTRTKIVMDTSFSGLLSAITGLDALGLVPRPSRLWSLIPYTFVVDWFFGIGKALERAESLSLLATIPAYYVHTYHLTSPLTVDEMSSLKASSPSSVPATLEMFCRDVTVFTPFPRDSRFGFGIPSGFPNGATFGSLLWQLIFS